MMDSRRVESEFVNRELSCDLESTQHRHRKKRVVERKVRVNMGKSRVGGFRELSIK
jgi:hypothetical protein